MIDSLREMTIKALDELKAFNINTLNIAHMTPIADYMIIASGNSSRHIQAIAQYIAATLKPFAFGVSIEGSVNNESDWVLVDLGDIVIHIMLPDSREYYALDKLWSPLNPYVKSS